MRISDWSSDVCSSDLLLWGTRSLRDLYLDERLKRWAMQYPQFRYTPVLSEPDATWKGASGFVHEALLQAHPTLAGHEAYLSGPPVMVRAGKDACIKAGVDADHLYYDSFDYAYQTWPQLGCVTRRIRVRLPRLACELQARSIGTL